MEFTVYQNSFQNCIHLIISAMIKRKGLNLDKIWGQSGLKYQETQGWPIISPYYRAVSKELKGRYGVHITESDSQNTDEYIQKINDLLYAGYTVGISADIYDLPYCIYYGKHHEKHMFEIVGFKNGNFILCDHYYHYQGSIDAKQLYMAIDSCFSILNYSTLGLFYLKTIDAPQKENPVLLEEIITDNCLIMEGNTLPDLKDQPLGTVLGLKAIQEIEKNILLLRELSPDQRDRFHDFLFNSIKEIANSRHNFHVFLRSYSQLELATKIQESAQNWNVVANMILRSHVLNDFSMLDRIIKRLDRTTDQEDKCVENMRRYLDKSISI